MGSFDYIEQDVEAFRQAAQTIVAAVFARDFASNFKSDYVERQRVIDCAVQRMVRDKFAAHYETLHQAKVEAQATAAAEWEAQAKATRAARAALDKKRKEFGGGWFEEARLTVSFENVEEDRPEWTLEVPRPPWLKGEARA